jgi:hypothetical protein
VERRNEQRRPIQVDIEIANPGQQRCRGYADNISRSGVRVTLSEGQLPDRQRSVVLNFKVWTGRETLFRKIYARVMRCENDQVALEFAEHDFVAEAIIQDLLFYQSRERRRTARNKLRPDHTTLSPKNIEQAV